MRLHIKNGRVIDPASGGDAVGDVYVVDGKISASFSKPEKTIDAKGLVVAPGFIDIAARLREPGLEYKATLESEMSAAVAGGVTSLACPPDTDPPLDEPGLVDMLRRRAKALARARVYPVASYRAGFAFCALFVLIGAAITLRLQETGGTNVHHRLRPTRARAGSGPRRTRGES